MHKKIITLFVITLFATSSFADNVSIEDKINKLNNESINSLGISLSSLSYLVQASPNSFIPLWHLKESGDIKYIHELEKSGYVKVTITKGLPNGQMPDEEQVNITPLKTGAEVQRCMIALKHNE